MRPFNSGPMNREWLDILVCPMSRQRLRLDADGSRLISDAAGLAYPICENVPVLLLDAATPLEEPARNQLG